MAIDGLPLENGQHDFLDNFFRRVFGAAALAGDGEDKRPIAAREIVPGHRIAAVVEALEQTRLGLRAGDHRYAVAVATLLRPCPSLRTMRGGRILLRRSAIRQEFVTDSAPCRANGYLEEKPMNTIFFAAIVALGAQDVQVAPKPTTHLYVKTVPPGATVTLDGKMLGKSDNLFDATSGTHKLALKMDGYAADNRSIEIVDGEITRVEVDLKKQSSGQVVLSYVGDSSDGQQSFADSGHAVLFQRPAEMKSITGIKIFAARYGYPQPPKEDFHVYLLDENQKVLEQIAIPYRKIERGDLRWYALDFPAVAVPEKFFVALWFNAEASKGIYVGMKKDVPTDTFLRWPARQGLSEQRPAFRVDDLRGDVVRKRQEADVSEGDHLWRGEGGRHGKHRGAARRNGGRSRRRTWNDATGAFSVEAEFAGVEDGKVKLKKADGKIATVPLDRLSKEDQEFVAKQAGAEAEAPRRAPRRAANWRSTTERRPTNAASPAAAMPCVSRPTATRATSPR